MTRGKPLRIAYGRITQETHAFSPVSSDLVDFTQRHYFEGEALERLCHPLVSEFSGLAPVAELTGFAAACWRAKYEVERVPLLSAWAMPSGPLTEAAIETLRERLRGALEAAGALDGVFFSLHGAMRGRGDAAEPEEIFLTTIREVVGPSVPIAVTYDLHGQMTQTKIATADITVGYKSNPHYDLFQAGYRAATLLLKAARGEARPVTSWRSLPMVLGGGTTIDFLAPMRAVFRRLKEIDRAPNVLAASLFMCHIWNDSPSLGWSVVVTTDGDEALAERFADELAELAWSVRHELPPSGVTPSEAIAQVRQLGWRRRLGTCCLCDASDIVGAGATGESTHTIRALLEEGEGLLSYAPIRDAVLVDALWSKAVGDAVDEEVGGRFDPEMYPPLRVRGRLRSKHTTDLLGRVLVLDLGHLQLVVSELAPYTLRPSFFGALGLNPWRADCVVVKSLFHFRIFFLPINRRSFLVQTRGLTDFDISDKKDFDSPTHPYDVVEDWRFADRLRRGIS